MLRISPERSLVRTVKYEPPLSASIAVSQLSRGTDLKGPIRPGWSGHIGATALYYAAFSQGDGHRGGVDGWEPSEDDEAPAVLVHGLSTTPLTRLHGRFPGD